VKSVGGQAAILGGVFTGTNNGKNIEIVKNSARGGTRSSHLQKCPSLRRKEVSRGEYIGGDLRGTWTGKHQQEGRRVGNRRRVVQLRPRGGGTREESDYK